MARELDAEKLDAFLYAYSQDEALLELMLELRDFVLKNAPEAEECLKYKTLFYTCKGLLCYISYQKKEKILYLGFCDGKRLKDPEKLLTGQHLKQIGHYRVNSTKDLNKSLKKLLREAVEFRLKLRSK